MQQLETIKENTLRELTVLYVEDDPLLREELAKFLLRRVKKLYLAENGEAGLELFEKNKPDMVLSDVRMPVMDGLKMSEIIKKKSHNTPVILATAYDDSDLLIKAIDIGVDKFIKKPIKIDILLEDMYRNAKIYFLEKKKHQTDLFLQAILDGITYPNLNNIINFIPYPFYIINASDYSIVYANSSASKDNRWMNMTCHKLTHKSDTPCDSEEHTCPLIEVKKTKSPVVVEHIHYDKDNIPKNYEVHGYPILDDEENVVQMIEFSIDITQRKIAEEKFMRLTISAQDAIVMIDDKGNISFWNNAAERIFGYEQQEVIGKNMHSLIAPEKYYRKFLQGFDKFKATGQGNVVGRTIELTAIRKNGEEFPVELSVSSIQLEGLWHSVGIVRDVTQRKELEKKVEEEMEKRLQSEKKIVENECQATIGLAITQIIHGAKNILNSLKGGKHIVDIALNNNNIDLIREGWDVTQTGISRMEQLTHGLLDLSRFNKLNLQPASLNTLADEIIHAFHDMEEDTEAKVVAETAVNLPEISFDYKAIHTAVMNLVSNAIAACQEKEYKGGEKGRVLIRTFHDENYAVMDIEDNGCGISEDEIDKIFALFYSTKFSKGNGLGLPITKKIIEEHNGKLEVLSEVNRGTTFRLKFPVRI